MFCFSCDEILFLGCIRIDLRVFVTLKMSCTLLCQKILPDSSLRPGTEGTEMNTFFLTSKPVSGFFVQELLISFQIL